MKKAAFFVCAVSICLSILFANAKQAEAKSPALAWGLSFCLPAGGQFYNGQYLKGLLFLGGEAIGVGLMLAGIITTVIGDETIINTGRGIFIGTWILSWIDAPISAALINKRQRESKYNLDLEADLGYIGLRLSRKI